MNGITKKCLRVSSIALLAALSSSTFAAGYKLEFQSASVLADAGEAAVVEDAGTNWYNSAGLTRLPQQVVLSSIEVFSATTFSGTATAPSTLPGELGTVFGVPYSLNDRARANSSVYLPAMHYSMPLPYQDNRFSLGLSVVPAWGLMEDYGDDSVVRYNLTRVYTRTIDVAPSVAMKITPLWSVGIGPDIHYLYISSKVHVNTQSIPGAPVGTGSADSISRFSANNWGYGGHIGVLYAPTDTTRFGVNYRSRINMDMSGYSDFAGIGTGLGSFESDSFKLAIPLPPVTTLSAYHDMTSRWAMMGTISYEQWSVQQNYHAQDYVTPPPTGTLSNVNAPQHMTNTFDFGIGTHYVLNDKWMLRGNLKYVATPTVSTYRGLNFPDGPKLGFQIGSRFQAMKKVAIDMLYGHVFTKGVAINDVNPVTGAVATGTSHTSIDLIGAQLVWDI